MPTNCRRPLKSEIGAEAARHDPDVGKGGTIDRREGEARTSRDADAGGGESHSEIRLEPRPRRCEAGCRQTAGDRSSSEISALKQLATTQTSEKKEQSIAERAKQDLAAAQTVPAAKAILASDCADSDESAML